MSVFTVTTTSNKSWSEITEDAVKRLTLIVHKTTIDLFSRVIKRTPVDSGRTRGNWQFQVGTIPKGVLDTVDKSGAKAQAAMVSDIVGWNPSIKAYIANNVPWILKLENGGYPMEPKTGTKTVGGYSKQAPAGMVKISVAEFSDLLQAASRG